MSYRTMKAYGHELGLSACFRQWRADSHCQFLHGYALSIRFEFEADTLDERNWVIDFGDLKDLKQLLCDAFDHKTLVAKDDPMMPLFNQMAESGLIQMIKVDATGCEAFARMMFDVAEAWLDDRRLRPRVRIASVEVREHGANSAIYTG